MACVGTDSPPPPAIGIPPKCIASWARISPSDSCKVRVSGGQDGAVGSFLWLTASQVGACATPGCLHLTHGGRWHGGGGGEVGSKGEGCSQIPWLIILNTGDRSSKINRETLLLSRFLLRSSTRVSNSNQMWLILLVKQLASATQQATEYSYSTIMAPDCKRP